MRISCWIPTAAKIYSEYVMRIAVALQQWLTITRLNVNVIRALHVLLLRKDDFVLVIACIDTVMLFSVFFMYSDVSDLFV